MYNVQANVATNAQKDESPTAPTIHPTLWGRFKHSLMKTTNWWDYELKPSFTLSCLAIHSVSKSKIIVIHMRRLPRRNFWTKSFIPLQTCPWYLQYQPSVFIVFTHHIINCQHTYLLKCHILLYTLYLVANGIHPFAFASVSNATFLYVCVSVCVCLTVFLSVCLSLSLCLSVCQCVCMYIYLPANISFDPPTHPHVWLYIFLSFLMTVRLFLSLCMPAYTATYLPLPLFMYTFIRLTIHLSIFSSVYSVFICSPLSPYIHILSRTLTLSRYLSVLTCRARQAVKFHANAKDACF